MSKEIARSVDSISSVMEGVMLAGDLSRLSPQQRTAYYMKVCESLGLNPATKPFDYVRLSGKEVLYATKGATDQLRRVYGVSVEIVTMSVDDGIMTVHARARTAEGRVDEDFGSLAIAGLKGEALANAKMKCVTKAKRRVTLSLCGLGMLDETEVDSIPGAVRVEHVDAVQVVAPANVSTVKAKLMAAPVVAPAPVAAPNDDELFDALPVEVQQLLADGDFETAQGQARAMYKGLDPKQQAAVFAYFKPAKSETQGAA